MLVFNDDRLDDVALSIVISKTQRVDPNKNSSHKKFLNRKNPENSIQVFKIVCVETIL